MPFPGVLLDAAFGFGGCGGDERQDVGPGHRAAGARRGRVGQHHAEVAGQLADRGFREDVRDDVAGHRGRGNRGDRLRGRRFHARYGAAAAPAHGLPGAVADERRPRPAVLRGSGCGGCGGSRCGLRPVVDHDDVPAHLDGVALGDQQFRHHPGVGARQFDEGLRGLDLEEDVVHGDGVTGFDLPRHDLGLGESFTDVGQGEPLVQRSPSGVSKCGGFRASGFRRFRRRGTARRRRGRGRRSAGSAPRSGPRGRAGGTRRPA